MRTEYEQRREKTKQIQEGLKARQMIAQGNAMGLSSRNNFKPCKGGRILAGTRRWRGIASCRNPALVA
jgi:hypothetical protein